MEKIEFSRPLPEVGCIIGHLFNGMVPPCDEDRCPGDDWMTVKYEDSVAAYFRCVNSQHYHMGIGVTANVVRFKGQTKGRRLMLNSRSCWTAASFTAIRRNSK